ncbi:hypothetical protein MWMV7_MWMV7_03361 [Acinetobacter calcoaceticus]|nr:hypothetical protein MWMV7_MWMV7_03361 [Acinetobacter calcoaceticus]
MLLFFNWIEVLFYNIVFYKYIFIKTKWKFYCRDILISILMMFRERKYELGTAIAKAKVTQCVLYT